MLTRIQDNATRFGVFLDSTFDHISAVRGDAEIRSNVVLALLGSLLTSHARASAESLGACCKAGNATGAERTAFTVAQRVRHTFRALTPEN